MDGWVGDLIGGSCSCGGGGVRVGNAEHIFFGKTLRLWRGSHRGFARRPVGGVLMSRGRHDRRLVSVLGLLAIWAAAPGCLRSTGLRASRYLPVEETNLPASERAAEGEGGTRAGGVGVADQAVTAPVLGGASAAAAGFDPNAPDPEPLPELPAGLAQADSAQAGASGRSSAAAGLAEGGSAPAPAPAVTANTSGQVKTVVSAVEPRETKSPVAAGTPMLDEALRRVEAVNEERKREHEKEQEKPGAGRAADSSIAMLVGRGSDTAEGGEPERSAKFEPGAAAEPARAGSSPPQELPELSVNEPATSGKSAVPAPAADQPEPQESPAHAQPPAAPAPPCTTEPDPPASQKSTHAEPQAPTTQAEPQAPTSSAHLKIADLKICRRVDGFAQVTPLDTPLQPGSLFLLYCELDGLNYEPRMGNFISRVSSRVEIRPSTSDQPVWARDLGIAEDICRRERKDYYVTYRVLLPSSLPPGDYVLRLTQTDLVSHSSADSELPLSVTR